MLLFELFPALLMLASLLVGIALLVANRRARDEPAPTDDRPSAPLAAEGGGATPRSRSVAGD